MFRKYIALLAALTMPLQALAFSTPMDENAPSTRSTPTFQQESGDFSAQSATFRGQDATRSDLSATAAPQTQIPSTGHDYTPHAVLMQEQMMLNLLNQDRKNHGLPALVLDEALSAIARAKSQDMNEKGYFSHTSPTWGSPRDMLRHFGYKFNGASENIAHHATVEKAQAAFMSSSGHRRNILGQHWEKVGIGIAFDRDGFIYATQLFAR